MSPPPPISPVAAAMRAGGGMLLGAAPLLLAWTALDHILDSATSQSYLYLLVMLLGALALGYVGSLRAAITHQKRTQLALQTSALVVPGVLLARLAGAVLLAGGLAAPA